jgi:hypothetical protein
MSEKFDFEALIAKSDLRRATLRDVPRWGIDVEVMEVSAAEQIRIVREASDDGIKQNKLLIKAGLTSPRLSDEQIDRLLSENTSLAPVDYIIRGIKRLSGLTEEDQKRLDRSFLD